ncbi:MULTISPECIES: YpfN family protein [unclassified Brenneria]|uniref:YpfN family protein n=1 Tax=unclassified Brenneria TaxID=2634434 RepID=UPI001554FEF0|nr:MULTISPECIES: YpfN family protein [unclassified Brenneria]MBJ7221719.1 YpfN family protein [Brenneria sp. L3-3C-1]MEE3642960.1 YpfN family protein [Brenneria sp. L3_3C_1]MEE3650854.1 YpfN family protein [Brenneria sp. HEZEL_4_2_4]NPD00809.1 YpfN family protein [Brenneria sp. hezel4-2-4]
MAWLADYWWIILIILFGMLLNGIKELRNVDHKRFLLHKPKLPPHRDNNDKWDEEDDDWPKKKP